MKDEIDYKTAYETAMIGFKMQMQEIERLNNIINKVKEYIEDSLYVNKETGEYVLTHTFDKDNLYKLFKILEKEV